MTVASCPRAARPLVVLAVVIGVVSAAVHGLAAQSAPAPPPEVTAIGCVAQPRTGRCAANRSRTGRSNRTHADAGTGQVP